jgi:hypothetical protein
MTLMAIPRSNYVSTITTRFVIGTDVEKQSQLPIMTWFGGPPPQHSMERPANDCLCLARGRFTHCQLIDIAEHQHCAPGQQAERYSLWRSSHHSRALSRSNTDLL